MAFAAADAQSHGQAQASASTGFTSKEFGFTISFPVEPTLVKQHLSEEAGDQYMYKAAQPDLTYIMIIMDGPVFAGPFDDARLKIEYDVAQKTFIEDTKGSRLISQADVKIGGATGREMSFETETQYGKARFVLTRGRNYSVLAVAPRSAETNAATNIAMTKFLDSFRFN